MLGDKTGGLLRSFDQGRTFKPVVEGAQGVAVNGVFTDRGLLYGLDNVYLPYSGSGYLVVRAVTR